MRIGELLIAQGLVNEGDVEQARQRQVELGGRLGQNLVDIGALTQEQLDSFLYAVPPEPGRIEDLDLGEGTLQALLLKTILMRKLETTEQIGRALHVSNAVAAEALTLAAENKLLEILGTTEAAFGSQYRYGLTVQGRAFANDALELSKYVGPVPVSLIDYCDRIRRQKINNEPVNKQRIEESFSDLIVPPRLLNELGPAINSGRSMLLYGAPGNGKSSLAERIGDAFRNTIFVPHCFEVDGEIIKVFDPTLHHVLEGADGNGKGGRSSLQREGYDRRWVPVQRPLVTVGGELTLEMLDLQYEASSGFYEAPMHIKALNGIMMIDDFGRQLVPAEQLLNRWIIPLERRIDYLKLHTGKSFELPFDSLVVFSTNLSPSALMDPAFLRRIPYKVEIHGPDEKDYRTIFAAVAKAASVPLEKATQDFVIAYLSRGHVPLAAYHPKFITDQVVAACKFEDRELGYHEDLVKRALQNLITTSMEDFPEGIQLAS
ncbi:MAG: AAA family ATPase [Rhodovibrionaceae bacterium]